MASSASEIVDLTDTEHIEVRLSGFGGQGILLAGYMLGQALTVYSHRAVVMAQSYGPESRGGASQVELIISSGEISYPRVEHPNVVVALSQQAYASYGATRPDEALLIVDTDLVTVDETLEGPRPVVAAPITRWAEEKLGKRITANIVMLGFLCGLTGLVEPGALERAVVQSAPKGSAELNTRALRIGLEQASSYRGERQGGS